LSKLPHEPAAILVPEYEVVSFASVFETDEEVKWRLRLALIHSYAGTYGSTLERDG
jgi:hypothetical protein